MLMILARLARSESFWAVVKIRSPHTGREVWYPRLGCCISGVSPAGDGHTHLLKERKKKGKRKKTDSPKKKDSPIHFSFSAAFLRGFVLSVVLHTAVAWQTVNELACGDSGIVHGAKCIAVLNGVA